MRKLSLYFGLTLILAVAAPHAAAQTFDNTGTAHLSGPYLFRYVNFFNDQYGNLTESCTLTGVMTFDGLGKYTVTDSQLFDSQAPGSCASLGGGNYGAQSNGMAQFDNPLYPATLFGSVSEPVIIASSTEDFYFDLFIAIQAPAAALSNGNLAGTYTVGTLDFVNASATTARQGYFTMNADGHGNIGAFALHGTAANLQPSDVIQNIPASTYALSSQTGGTLTIPVSVQYSAQNQIVSGSKTLFVTADGNYVLGGDPNGSDMIFGFRAPTGTSSNALLSGTYFLAGMANDISSGFLGAYFGAINTNGDGNLIRHERLDYVASYQTYDYTANTPVTIGADGSYNDGLATYLVSANGAALMRIGSGTDFTLTIGTQATYVAPATTVWINPYGITNAANYTPITNAYAPGELVSLYGIFGASLAVDQILPIPATLNGVQVLVNGKAAPVFLTSANQISALIPYEVAGDYFATFQVIVNNVKSNEVTVYVDYTSPGIYTYTENGIGPGAILHADYTQVNENSPAAPGETVLLFMNGLGTVSPTVDDGAAASTTTLSWTDEIISMYLDDGVNANAIANVDFSGLAPGFSGLYQVNFTLPTSGIADGDVSLLLYTTEAISEMAKIPVKGFTTTPRVSPRKRIAPAGHPGTRRRALPPRG